MRTRHFVLFSALLALLLVAPTFATAAHASHAKLVIDPAPVPAGTEFEACDEIIENTTDTKKTVTVTICNPGTSTMIVDVSGREVTRIRPGKCKTIIVELGPGEFLHADENGTVAFVVTPTALAKKP